MSFYRKKPVVIEAWQFLNWEQFGADAPDWLKDRQRPYGAMKPGEVQLFLDPIGAAECLVIATLEGDHWAFPTAWIIKGVQDEIYPCKADIFAATYELVDAQQ